MTTRWIPIGEIAGLLQVSRATVRRKLRAGDIPGFIKFLGYPRVDRKTFKDWWVKQDLG